MNATRAFASLAIVLLALGRAETGPKAPMSQYYRAIGYQVTFLITQNPKVLGATTTDQITILFANRSAGERPTRPFFGDDIVQEFSFSGTDFVNNQLRFTRRVNDKSFVNAPYIRVINYGGDGWEGEQISLTVDGQEILRSVRMQPRLGGQPSTGIQNFNPRNWATRSYWEAELSKYRAAGK